MIRARLEAHRDNSEEAEALKVMLETLEPLRNSGDLLKLLKSESSKMPSIPTTGGNKQFTKDVAVHLQRAHEMALAKDYQRSLSEIRSALRVNPRCSEALITRANVLAVLDRIDEALEALAKAEKLNPKNPLIYSIRGDILCNLRGDYYGSLEQYETALKLGLMKELVLPEWGTAMIALGRGEEAFKMVRDWNVDPTSPYLFIFRSQYYRMKCDYEAALIQADQAVQLSGKEPALELRQRAEVNEAMGRREQAIQDLERAVQHSVKGTSARRIVSERLNNLRMSQEPE